ncbi:FAD/NAD(P)-binding protein [Lactobacillus sp. Sy-1]|uniref:FAD/NAD(P)-binding protein n=1 Tax=Lactobacillus sp. Sy-1 TaxID=2109645 RepID=UPI001C56C987|nr:FAD/NAD(P)-binding protein [Lactobacillus sp. Sy-1]MBW1605259.1 FAD/NAD(P)-binding protein [Lactobacillus sp. Sy-1]
MKVGIIGGGPRGLITLSHLVHNFNQSNQDSLSIHLFDPFLPGGQVWRTDQSTNLIMNTIAVDLSLTAGTKLADLNLYQWSQTQAPDFIKTHHYPAKFIELAKALTPNSYSPRVLLGVYAQWFYQQIRETLPANVTVEYHQVAVKKVTATKPGWKITSNNGTIPVDQIVMTINTSVNQLTQTEQSLADYAEQNGLYYQAPAYPGDVKSNSISEEQTVIIRGLGMSFFDELVKLTIDRGGKFSSNPDGSLTYHPSGNEPHIYAGSRRGVTYYPKAVVGNNDDYQFTAHFVTRAKINQAKINGKLPVATFSRLMRHEIELVYYQLTLKRSYPTVDITEFTNQFVSNPEAAIQAGPFKPADILRWEFLLNPVAGTPITTTADYQQTLINWLRATAADAEAGLGVGPLSSALTVYKEVRKTLRETIEEDDFAESDYLSQFLTTFKSNSQLLSNGAPALRFRQLIALMNTGIVTILGPGMNVIGANKHFVALSKYYPKEPVVADALIEARIPRLNFATTKSELINGMLKNHIIEPAAFKDANDKSVPINAINIDPDTDQAISGANQITPGLFVFGTLTEGIRWLTTVFPMNGDDDNHHTAEQISHQILKLSEQSDELM